MKLSLELNDSINEQILQEYHNALVYAQIQSYFEDLQLKNIAEYFKKQSLQEAEHAQKFIQHLNNRTGGKVNIGDLSSVDLNFLSIESIGDIYISTEEGTTESIEALYDLVYESKSFIDIPFILSMLEEQVEEEDSANTFALKLKNVKDLILWDATLK